MAAPELPEVELVDLEELAPDELERPRRGALSGMVVLAVAVLGVVALLALVAEPAPAPTSSSPAAPTVGDIERREPAQVQIGPVFGEPVGLVIAVGGNDRDLQLVDLDTGKVSSIGWDLEPQLIEGGRLLTRDDWSRWQVIDLIGPWPGTGATPADGQLFAAAVPAEQGGVWFRHQASQGQQRWSRVDIASDTVLEEVITPPEAVVPSDSAGRPLSGPEMVASLDGGIYALGSDGSYAEVLRGRLVAFNRSLLLVSTCDAALVCTNRWVDRETLANLDLAAPEQTLGAAYIRGDDTLVAETHLGTSLVVKLFDIHTGAAIATGDSRNIARIWVSPGGRFIARPGYDSLLITDVHGGVTKIVGRLQIDPGINVVWGER